MALKLTSYCFLVLMLGCFFTAGLGFSQVKNDLIEHRLELKINAAPFRSNTTNCKVERACVDESLTGKCIEYHNDQWFWFKTKEAGNYYININGQQCRDTRGVQLVVIDGEPCQPKTYKILTCTSLASQDDIFVPLEGLKPNYSYLLNLDGYLEDFCDFKIQVSTEPVGLPSQPVPDAITTSLKITNNIVHHNWVIPEAYANLVHEYQVWRRHANEKKFILVSKVLHDKNTSGFSRLEYSSSDTVQRDGLFYYKIIGITNSKPLLLKEESIPYDQRAINSLNPKDNLTFNLDFKPGTPISIYVYDANTLSLIKKIDLAVQQKGQEIQFNVANLRQRGIRKITLRIVNQNTKLAQILDYSF